jgi:glycosyltransferase involved in cell wall biosynthesis
MTAIPTRPEASPVVTAVIIFLNAQSYIGEAIESVLTQTFEDWELILVDDGSTDLSSKIAQDYARRYPEKLRYLEHPGHENRGMSASRNLGIRSGRGTYVAFLDADDIWLPRRLESHVELMRRCPDVGMVYGPTLYWFSWASDPPRFPVQVIVDPKLDDLGKIEDFPAKLMLPAGVRIAAPRALISFLETGGGSLPGICSLTARRAAILEFGGFEEAFRGVYEDQVFLSKICLTNTVMIIDEVLDYYRQHDQSCCARAIGDGDYSPRDPHPARGRYLEWLSSYLIANKVTNRRLWAAVRNEEWPYRYATLHRLLKLAKGGVPLSMKRYLLTVLPQRWLRRLREAD